MTMADNKCECCNKETELVGVASIPYIPMSIAWCQPCLQSGAIPYWAAVANTACCNGLDNTNEDWKQLVKTTLKYFDKSDEEFEKDVQKSMEEQSNA